MKGQGKTLVTRLVRDEDREGVGWPQGTFLTGMTPSKSKVLHLQVRECSTISMGGEKVLRPPHQGGGTCVA